MCRDEQTITTTTHQDTEQKIINTQEHDKELLQQQTVTDGAVMQPLSQTSAPKVSTLWQETEQKIQSSIQMVSAMKMKSLEEASLTTIKYQHGAKAQKLAKSKRLRDKAQKEQKSRDKKIFEEMLQESKNMQAKVESPLPPLLKVENMQAKAESPLPPLLEETKKDESPFTIRKDAKDAYISWRAAMSRLNLSKIYRKKSMDQKAFLRKLEAAEEVLSVKEELENVDKKIRERADQEPIQEKELEKLEKAKIDNARKDDLQLLLSEDPFLEIKNEMLSLGDLNRIAPKEGEEGLRKDPFGIKRRENMHKYRKGGKLYPEDLQDEDIKVQNHGKGRLLSENQRKMADAITADINNLLNNIEVDLILSRKSYELPQSLMDGLKSYIVCKSMNENLMCDMTFREEEAKKRTAFVQDQINNYREKRSKLQQKIDIYSDEVKKLENGHFRMSKEAVQELERKIDNLTGLTAELDQELANCEQELKTLTVTAAELKEAMASKKMLSDKIKFMNPQGNSYIREMRRRQALKLAIELVEGSEAGDYRDSMLEALDVMKKDNEEALSGITSSIYRTLNVEKGSMDMVSDDQLNVLTTLAETYDRIRELRETIPKLPTDRAETDDEKATRERALHDAEDETVRLMNVARDMFMSL